MNPFYVNSKEGDRETPSDEEDDYIPECITTSSSGCLPTPKPTAGLPASLDELENPNSCSDSNSDINNIKVPSLRGIPKKVLNYIHELTSVNKTLMMKVQSVNGNDQVPNAKEEIAHLKKTVKELTEELEQLKRPKRSNRKSFKSEKTSGQKPNKTTAVVRKVINDKTTKSNKTIESKTTNTHHTKQGDSKSLKNTKGGRIEIRKPTESIKISKPKAVKVPPKPSTIVEGVSKETATTINTKSRSMKKTTSVRSLKESGELKNTKSTLSTESLKQHKKTSFAELGKISISKNTSSSSSSSPGDVAVKSPTSTCSTIQTDIEDETVEMTSLSHSTIHTDIEGVAAITPSLSSSTIHTDIDGSACSMSSSRSTDSVSPFIKDEFMIQKGFQGTQKTAKTITMHSTSSSNVPYSISKIASGNSNQYITEVRHKKRLGLTLPSLINPENSTTPPKIKSSSTVNESPQNRSKMAKKVGATPLPNLMKSLSSVSGRFTPKPPSTPRTSTTNITKLPPISPNAALNKRQD